MANKLVERKISQFENLYLFRVSGMSGGSINNNIQSGGGLKVDAKDYENFKTHIPFDSCRWAWFCGDFSLPKMDTRRLFNGLVP